MLRLQTLEPYRPRDAAWEAIPFGRAARGLRERSVVAASHRDLRRLVAEGRFREDRYHRPARFELTVPPRRERGRDVVVIARALLAAGIDGVPARHLARNAGATLEAHHWLGHVRELGNVAFRAALLAREGAVTALDAAAAFGAEPNDPEGQVSQRCSTGRGTPAGRRAARLRRSSGRRSPR